MKVNIYLDAYLHHFVSPFRETVTQSAKGGMCFFREKPSLILHNVVWKILGAKKVKIYLNTYLHNLFLPITESVSESAKKRNLSAYMLGFLIDFSWETSSVLG